MPITYFVAFLVSLMVGASLTLVVRGLAYRFDWLDRAASSRKVHARPIPRLGGIAIVAGFFAPLLALLVVDSFVGLTFRAHPDLVVGLFTGGFAIALLGLFDDLRGADARLKFSVQIAVSLFLYWLGFRMDVLANPFGPAIHLGALAPVLTVFWIVGVINALNLIDGLDGLAGGVAFFGVATNFILAISRGDIIMCLCMACLAGAILGFLIFNFNPASIFMGDTGSMFLGFVLAAVSIKTSEKSGTAVAILVPIISLGLPIMDTLLAIIRRSLLGRPVFSADKEHIHHRLMSRLFLSHRKAVLLLYGLCCLFGLTALGLAYANSAQTAMLLTGVGIVVFVLMRKLGYLSLEKAQAVTRVRRKNLELRAVVREIAQAIRSAGSLHGIWDALVPIAGALDAWRLELRIEDLRADENRGVAYELTRGTDKGVPFAVRVELRAANRTFGSVGISWRDGRLEVDRDAELALELIADEVSDVAQRLLAPPSPEARVLTFRK